MSREEELNLQIMDLQNQLQESKMETTSFVYKNKELKSLLTERDVKINALINKLRKLSLLYYFLLGYTVTDVILTIITVIYPIWK